MFRHQCNDLAVGFYGIERNFNEISFGGINRKLKSLWDLWKLISQSKIYGILNVESTTSIYI